MKHPPSPHRRHLLTLGLAGWTLLASGCASRVLSRQTAPAWAAQARWALLPLLNHSDTPQAALSAEALLTDALHQQGVTLHLYPADLGRDTLLEPNERKAVQAALAWAHQQGLRYALGGSVHEWRYKVGVDGEPAVSLSLHVVDLSNDQVVWSASGARSGSSRESLAGLAQRTVADLLGAWHEGAAAPSPA